MHLFDLASGTDSQLPITAPISRLQVAPYLASPLDYISSVELHPEGHSLLVCRG